MSEYECKECGQGLLFHDVRERPFRSLQFCDLDCMSRYLIYQED